MAFKTEVECSDPEINQGARDGWLRPQAGSSYGMSITIIMEFKWGLTK